MNFSDIRPYIYHCEKLDIENFSCSGETAAYNYVFIYLNEGNAELYINQKKYILSRGRLAILKPACFYKITPTSDDFETLVIHFDYTTPPSEKNKKFRLPCSFDKFNASQVNEMYFSSEKETYFNSDIIVDSFEHIAQRVAKMFSVFTKNSEYREMILSSHMTLILTEIMENVKTIKIPLENNAGVKNDILEYIHQNYNQNITLDEISKKLNFHKSYINVIVKKETGFSVHKYITVRRISKAVELLQFSEFSISEIAEIVGIPDISHFSKSFRQLIGKSPRQFRKNDK